MRKNSCQFSCGNQTLCGKLSTYMLHRLARIFLLTLSFTLANAAVVSYTGTFTGDGDVQLFNFQLTAPATVTAQTWSFAGGINAAGTVIAPGGFSPHIWLFDSSGILLQADSPESPDHTAPSDCGPRAIDPSTGFCWDAYLNVPLTAGSYTLALTQDGNVLVDGFSLASGFTEQGVDITPMFLAWEANSICLTG